jgi:translation initiation factor 2 alpha subunit (eIF-2alpha)
VKPTVPIGVKCFAVIDPNIPRTTYCHVTKNSSENSTTYDMRLMDSYGKVYITIEQFKSTDITDLIRSPKLGDISYQTEWIESQLKGKSLDLSGYVVIIMKDCHGIASSFMDTLTSCSDAKV